MSETWGVYAHIPWCRRRCPYCAFYVEVDRDVPWAAFAKALVAELALRRPEFPGQASTLFFGGGTPSRMPAAHLREVVAAVDASPSAEIAMEANPEDVTPEAISDWLNAGVNRISLGLQTFNPKFAHLLNRACSVQHAQETAAWVSQSGVRSWSMDIIFGLPGQTLADLSEDLERLLETDPPHVSLYGLTIEEGTAFERGFQRGTIVPAPDDLWREMYDLLVERLAERGIQRYEVSNFAKDGHRSKHNELYWTDRPYLAIGPSAHGYTFSGIRWKNVADVGRYLQMPDPTIESERPTGKDRAIDRLFSGLRYVGGVSRTELREKCAQNLSSHAVAKLVQGGWIADDGEKIHLTNAGFPIADTVIVKVLDALTPAEDGSAQPD